MPTARRCTSTEPAMTTSTNSPSPAPGKEVVERTDIRFLLRHPAHLLAFGFGSGLAPKAPGTVGTLLGLPLFWLVTAAAADRPNQFILIIAAFLFGVWACARTGRALGVADHGGMVWDEIVAFALVLMFIPALPLTPSGWPLRPLYGPLCRSGGALIGCP